MLSEKYCDTGGILNEDIFECLYGCSNGACVEEVVEEDMCTDTDGGDEYYEKGYRINNDPEYAVYGQKSWDYCIYNPFIYSSGGVVSDSSKEIGECK